MTLEPSLDKHQVDFAHNYAKIRLRCPECVRTTKGKNHVKLFRNTAGLWWHFKNEHDQISNSQFTTEDVKEVLRWITMARSWGMFPDSIYNCNTATSSLLYDGKPARRDVGNKLKEIAEIMKGQSDMYPDFKAVNILAYMKIVLGNSDERTKKKYFDCITNYSNKNWQNGTYDATEFCNKVT